jgi:hypothetical protein
MKARIDKAALMVPLYRAQGVVDRKATTNVIACVHISAGDDGLVFSATDYDVTMTASVAAEVLARFRDGRTHGRGQPPAAHRRRPFALPTERPRSAGIPRRRHRYR